MSERALCSGCSARSSFRVFSSAVRPTAPRFFFALSGVIPTSELPINWGLIEWYPEINQNCMKIVRPSGKFHPDKVREHMLLVTVIRRIGESNRDDRIVLKQNYKEFIDNSTLLNLEPIV